MTFPPLAPVGVGTRSGSKPVAAATACGVAILVFLAVSTAPQPPGADEPWRWCTIGLALLLCCWNVRSAYRAFDRYGVATVVGFLHVWLFLAFSFPAAEMVYRYSVLELNLWSLPADDPTLVRAVVLLGVFQLLFFTTLGHRVDDRLAARLSEGRAAATNPRLAALLLCLAAPLFLARFAVISMLGLQGAATAAVTRGDYFERVGGVNPALWFLNMLFPIFAVVLLCLAVKYLVPHPTAWGRRLYLCTLVLCAAGVAISGGRAELVFIMAAVVITMYVQGYRTMRLFAPMLAPLGVIFVGLLIVAHARVGGTNALSDLAGSPYQTVQYARGDVTQALGLGRFDAMVMILDRHENVFDLKGQSYWDGIVGAANFTFLPHIALGAAFPIWHVGEEVLGPWVFGMPYSSALPSAPGELYLNFGIAGVVLGAVVLAVVARVLFQSVAKLPGPIEIAWLLLIWTVARFVSDESYLIFSFAVRTWPFVLALSLLLRHMPRVEHGRDREPTHQGPLSPQEVPS